MRYQRTYCLHPYRIILDAGTRRSKEDNTTVRRIVDHVVSYHAVAASNTDTICPLLKELGTSWTDIVVLDDGVSAVGVPLRHMETGPTPWIKRVNELDHLVGIRATHFDVCTPGYRRRTETCAIDLHGVSRDEKKMQIKKVSPARCEA